MWIRGYHFTPPGVFITQEIGVKFFSMFWMRELRWLIFLKPRMPLNCSEWAFARDRSKLLSMQISRAGYLFVLATCSCQADLNSLAGWVSGSNWVGKKRVVCFCASERDKSWDSFPHPVYIHTKTKVRHSMQLKFGNARKHLNYVPSTRSDLSKTFRNVPIYRECESKACCF